MLDLAKIEAGKLELCIEDVDLDALVTECMVLISTLADKRDITVKVNGITGTHVRADLTRLKQVLLNLLSNAVKYNNRGGSLTLDCINKTDNTLRISITDTGDGIKDDMRHELFKPFSRLGAENSEIEGTGIGLTITKQLVEAMGGQIGFYSKISEGSTFWVELHNTKDHENNLPETENDSADNSDKGSGVKGKILYIEDNPANISLMTKAMTHYPSVELLAIHNAELGIEMAIQNKPDLILMDINLPGMNGLEALAELRRKQETRDIPAIAISAAAMPRDIEKGLEAGFLAYLTKPFNIVEVLQTIAKALDTKTNP